MTEYLQWIAELRPTGRLFIFAGILLGLWFGLQRTALDLHARTLTWLAVVVPFFAWYGVLWLLASGGAFETRLDLGGRTFPITPLAIFLPVAIWLAFLMRSRRIAAVLDAVSPAWLVGFQVYRVLGAVFLLRWAAGELPGEFALPAGTGDVLVGLLALPVGLYVYSGARGGRAAAYAWNLLGIADLLVAITLGALTATGRIPVTIPNTTVTTYPFVMIPAFAVPLSLILHVVSLWQLKRAARQDGAAMTAAGLAAR